MDSPILASTLFSNTLTCLATLPDFIAQLVVAIALTTAFLTIYTIVTPQHEFSLIREGNVAAAVALSGSLLGFVIALASAITHSVSLLDSVVWGGVALVIQLLVFGMVRLFMRSIVGEIEHGNVAVGTLLGMLSVAIGILNAACMSY